MHEGTTLQVPVGTRWAVDPAAGRALGRDLELGERTDERHATTPVFPPALGGEAGAQRAGKGGEQLLAQQAPVRIDGRRDREGRGDVQALALDSGHSAAPPGSGQPLWPRCCSATGAWRGLSSPCSWRSAGADALVDARARRARRSGGRHRVPAPRRPRRGLGSRRAARAGLPVRASRSRAPHTSLVLVAVHGEPRVPRPAGLCRSRTARGCRRVADELTTAP